MANASGIRGMSGMPSPKPLRQSPAQTFTIQRRRDLTIRRHLSASAANSSSSSGAHVPSWINHPTKPQSADVESLHMAPHLPPQFLLRITDTLQPLH